MPAILPGSRRAKRVRVNEPAVRWTEEQLEAAVQLLPSDPFAWQLIGDAAARIAGDRSRWASLKKALIRTGRIVVDAYSRSGTKATYRKVVR